MISRGLALFLVCVTGLWLPVACAQAESKGDPTTASLKRALEYLFAKQAPDGGWHSETYGSMRQGAATTALVLYAISHVPEKKLKVRRDQLQKGFDFLKRGIELKGFVCNPDGTPDFPTYASAMALTAARRLKLHMSSDVENQLVEFLLVAQVGERREFAPENPHYGGWDLMGLEPVRGQTSGTNVSLGRFVLEALADSEHPKAKEAIARARRWAHSCQDYPDGDGGFHFTPDFKFQSNKAGLAKDSETQVRSYGSTTCDGICCLMSTGVKCKDPRVAAAINWLVKRPIVKVVPGFKHFKQSTGWEKGLRFYYYSGIVKVLPYFPAKAAKTVRSALAELLVRQQRNDGSWVNESARMREDDPLISTSLAVIALAELLR